MSQVTVPVVWVVSLNNEPLQPGHSLTFQGVPVELEKYFYPKRWGNKRETEYIGFRFRGRLQYIARIVSRREIPNFDTELPGLTVDWASDPHVVLELEDVERVEGPRSGQLWNRQVYCHLDLLKSCTTVLEAANKTAQRR